MRKKLLFALMIALLATVIVAVPAFAWTGVYGQCIDSGTLQGWAYGGTVTVYGNVTGAIPGATGPLVGDGTFNVALPPGLPDATLYIVIVYNAGPLGTPGTYIETIPYIPTGIPYNAGYVHTDTGPNAVTLANAQAQSPSQWLLAALAAVALVGVGGAALVLRRRRVA